MIDANDLQRFEFNLSELRPVEILLKNHEDIKEYFFDMHYEYELGILISGRMKREYVGHQMEIGPGEVWLCDVWEPHGFAMLETPCEVVVFVCDPEFMVQNTLLNRNILLPFQAPPQFRPKTAVRNRQLLIELAKKAKENFKRSDNADWAKLQFLQALLIVMESWKAPKDSNEVQMKKTIRRALELVFDEKRLILTTEAAAACGMSVSKFRALFKVLMHSSFSEFALKYRVGGAIRQLRNSNDTQEAVAIHWGFTDASHLHKNIKKFEEDATLSKTHF